jgi:flavin reductase (DIM6/NTAB) family NADH-FMN oxidoreductase RutF
LKENPMDKMRIDPLASATRLINHGPCVLITVGDRRRDNLFTVAWNMPVRKDPPLVAVESGKSHFSYDFIARTGEFGINVPTLDIAKEVLAAGTVSGASLDDKFAHVGLTREPASAIKAPLVAEAVANLECRVCQLVDLGASALLIAQVVDARANPAAFSNGEWRFEGGLKLLHHLGGNAFTTSDGKITF